MSELSDYQRMVEKPYLAKKEAQIKLLNDEIERLRAALAKAQSMPRGKQMTLKEYLQSLIDNKETDVEKLQKALIEATRAIDEAVETASYALTKLAAERRKSKRIERETTEAVKAIVEPWLSVSHMKLHAGEMSAQEVRTTQAVLNSIVAAIRALGENK